MIDSGSGERAGVLRHVHGVLAQEGQGYDVQGPLVRAGQDDRRRHAVLVGLEPAHRDDAPPVPGLQAEAATPAAG